MNSPPRWFALVALLFLASCSTPQSRIGDHQAEFDKFPPDVQQKISHGQVDVGFTEEMVRLALGEPDRRFTRKTEAGELDVWGYHERRARVSFGLGFGRRPPFRRGRGGGNVEQQRRSGGENPHRVSQ